MEGHGSPPAGGLRPVDPAAKTKKVVVSMSKGEESERRYFIKRMEEEKEEEEWLDEADKIGKKRPLPRIVMYLDLLEEIWGWDRLIRRVAFVSLSDYTKYLEEYHRRNVHAATTETSISALAETCLKNEEQLVSELMARVKPEHKSSLLMRRSIILSCLIRQRARSVVHTAGCNLSDVSATAAALLCIAKEADLTCELLRRDAHLIDNDIISEGASIRMCALSLMNCTRGNSVSASAVMLGMVKEAEIMCSWMHINKTPTDFSDDPVPSEMWDSSFIRRCTLHFMVGILEKSSAAEHKAVKEEPAAEHKTIKEEPARSGPGGDGDNIADGAANTTGGSQFKKGRDKSNKRKCVEEDLLGKIWHWERLVMLPDSSVKSSHYRSYLEEYYERNASGFVAAAAAKIPQNATVTDMGPAVAKFCLMMEEELLSVWNSGSRVFDDRLAINAIMESSLIKEHALLVCGTGVELYLPSAIAFVCIAKEAELMCELLKHGAKPSSQFIQLSSVIRICALGLVNLKGHQFFASAATMMGVANEAKEMCDWMKRENKLVTLSLSEACGIEDSHLIRNEALHIMTRILHESSFPSSKTPDDAMP